MTSLLDWLRGEHDLGERLELIDNLCRALVSFHERAPSVRPGLDPTRVEITPDLGVSLEPADPNEDSFQVPEYRAPEVVAGARYTPTAGTYSAALLCYELLAGRHPFVMDTPLGPVEAASNVPPAALADLRPDLPRDLAEAVMPCLERDPEWRPKDLSYLMETLRKARATVPASPRRRAAVKAPPPKPAPKPVAKPAAGPAPVVAEPSRREPIAARESGLLSGRSSAPASKSRLPLFVAAAAGLLAVLGGLWYLTQPSARPSSAPAAGRAAASPAPAVSGAPAVEPTGPPSAAPITAASLAPSSAPSAAFDAATPAPLSTPTPVAVAAAPSLAPATPVPARETPPPAPVEARRETPTPPPAATPLPAPAAPVGPIVIAALVPSKLRRGPTVLVDVRGSGLRAGLDARILFKGREPATGVQVVSQRVVNAGLLVLMLRIDAQARDGSYALTLADASGASNARTFDIGR